MFRMGVQPVDGFKGYLDRQFTSGSCAPNIHKLSKVYSSVTNGKVTLFILAKTFVSCTLRREVNTYMKARPESVHNFLKLDL